MEMDELRIMKKQVGEIQSNLKRLGDRIVKFGQRRKNAMFNELLESSSEKKKTNTGWSVILSAIVQISALLVLILIPLIYTQALPQSRCLRLYSLHHLHRPRLLLRHRSRKS